jgi:hypothetical protein
MLEYWNAEIYKLNAIIRFESWSIHFIYVNDKFKYKNYVKTQNKNSSYKFSSIHFSFKLKSIIWSKLFVLESIKIQRNLFYTSESIVVAPSVKLIV